MSRYYPLGESSQSQDSIITPGDRGDADPITFSPGSKTKNSVLTRKGGTGGSTASMKPGKMVGEY